MVTNSGQGDQQLWDNNLLVMPMYFSLLVTY